MAREPDDPTGLLLEPKGLEKELRRREEKENEEVMKESKRRRENE